MAEKQDTKLKVETVPLYKFRNIEKRAKTLEEDITELRAKVQSQERELSIANQSVEDEDGARVVRQALMKEYAELDKKIAQYEKDAADTEEKVTLADAKELRGALKEEGIEVTTEDLLAAESMEAKASELRVGHYKTLAEQKTTKGAAKEGAEVAPEASAEGIYDTSGAGTTAKDPNKKSDAEFDDYWKQQYAEAQSR